MDKLSLDEFMEKITSLDGEFKAKIDKASKNGKTLRYVASISSEYCNIRIKEVEIVSDFGNLKGPDNIVVIKSKKYSDRSLVIKGPGAGVKVTAQGVFADILRIGGVL